jgi:hypothetical protein
MKTTNPNAVNYFVCLPGGEASGPYDKRTLGEMWERGQLVPGTLVAAEGEEWRDLAYFVPWLRKAAVKETAGFKLGVFVMLLGLAILALASVWVGIGVAVFGLVMMALSWKHK